MSLTRTANQIIQDACEDLGIIAPGEAPTAAITNRAFKILQELIDSWNLMSLTVLVVERTEYTLVANQQFYSIGPATLSPDFSTGTAARPVRVEGAGLILNATTPVVEVPLVELTDDLYENIGVKAQTSTQPTEFYYNPTDPLGEIFLWPAPTTGVNSLALYTQFLTPQMTALNTAYVMPPGYTKALRLNLCMDLSVPAFGLTLDAGIEMQARAALRNLKAANVKESDLSIDAALQPAVSGGSYNIFSDSGA
jgi:hypothetical protein